jgi:hypothetical protein
MTIGSKVFRFAVFAESLCHEGHVGGSSTAPAIRGNMLFFDNTKCGIKYLLSRLIVEYKGPEGNRTLQMRPSYMVRLRLRP